MAMLLNGKINKQGRCVNLSCSGRVSFTTTKTTCVCPVCGKHLSVLKEAVLPSGHEHQIPNSSTIERSLLDRSKTMDETSHSTSDDDSASMATEKPDQQEEKSNQEPSNTSDEEIAAFKRVILQEANDDVLEPFYVPWFVDIRNSEEVEKFYIARFNDMQHGSSRMMARAFVELLEPQKQRHYPYAKGNDKAPPWWPKTTGEKRVQHEEPDQLLKPERVRLLVHILRMVLEPFEKQHPSVQQSGLNVEALEAVTMDALSGWFIDEDRPEIDGESLVLEEIFGIARAEEANKNGEIDCITLLPTSTVVPSPPNELIESDDEDAEGMAAAYSDGEVGKRDAPPQFLGPMSSSKRLMDKHALKAAFEQGETLRRLRYS
ncbi:uncharacterized protein PAC_01285 [Phialocephala subalpina]|uniref:Subtelomeric hrmA-associated cluster protein AFUB-079030/YDR124W-like helical bundle domain-containing protein n=1 Tax=Phialocephala subalpina TaxID=576137 RepID=A0A1L7WF55_9HELO|nr:uncharacterized protein PAC_01285 [Phialocephala subalpina]